MTTQSKTQIAEAYAERAGVSRKAATETIDTLFDVILGTLRTYDRVALRDIGTFTVSTRAAGLRRNPRTGQEVQVPERKVIKFKAASAVHIA